MHILNLRRQPAGSRTLAVFDVQLNEQLRLCGLALKRSAEGALRTWAPRTGDRHAVSMHPDLASQITRAAEAALKGAAANVGH